MTVETEDVAAPPSIASSMSNTPPQLTLPQPTSPTPTSPAEEENDGVDQVADGEVEDDPLGSDEASTDFTDPADPQERIIEMHNPETAALLAQVSQIMNASHQDFSFACGGSVPIALPAETSETESQSSSGSSSSSHEIATTAASNPVTIRWDPRDPSTPAARCKLTFPLDSSGDEHQAMDGLLANMLPATFGLGGKDVYDESYRKAAKLDPSSFSTNFSPYETGIIATVAQMLLPDIEGDFAVRRAVKAELYKLNVYEGPSGHFHAHVDTPRSRSQFGSLVVCLPAAHEGGMLEVRHNGKAMQFDWSSTASNNNSDEGDDNGGGGDLAATIKWAAFYSDCEHEVFEVRAGHRVTLTYNLYAVSADTTRYDAVRAITSPLVGHMNALLDNKDFMPEGGYLGFYTTHAYAHTSDDFDPSSLKGVDMVIWQGFQRLGCGVCLRPILNADCWNPEDAELIVGGEDFSMHISECELRDRRDLEGILDEWDKDEDIKHDDIAWLNEPGNTQTQLIYTAYGNEAFATAFYSWCSIIIGVPPHGDEGRMALAEPYA
ncbi:hypothetical protein B0T26DRAFT_711472 [Lasiosphaeria miniovina]|uniref:Fe2OG dioxygenase domain-containing protein n=1 Tax=Lasiosphaeria miniovina TaxID=1954250 RepID=A0AA40ALB9_9PEZI|nr:uncharacterized protein B0T26DRAFT_711472 [Lasiosphaeria miniovina]KAK0717970.1 hypothetical protein B0T26DRAFT_711472 [Lasiosphaeria miniovina]